MNIITTLLFFSYITFTISHPIVNVGRAIIIGSYMHTRKGRLISAFRGIAYAEPPIGNLRFRNPIPKKNLNGIIMADKDGSMCVQYSKRSTEEGNEDCLFLNVYTPLKAMIYQKKKLPVMVYIHGGAYLYGSSSSLEYGPEYLLDSDVVLVTMNYRLGLLGFLSTGDGEAPGNFGLKDQVLALRWVQENIQNFGGNPQKVTLFGLSAGSNCVHFHTLSDASTGLFHQYIMQSGDAISYRSFQERKEYSKFARAVGERFGCPSNNSRLLVNCLRNVEVTRLNDSISIFNETRQLFEMMWTPTNEPDIDGAFITDTPFNLLRNKNRKDYPWINGLTKDEGLYFLKSLYTVDTYQKYLGDLDRFLTDFFITFPFVKDIPQVVKDVRNFYFYNYVMGNIHLVLHQLAKLTGDLFRYRYQLILSNHYSKTAQKPFFLYNFHYRGTISMTSLTGNNEDVGVCHGDDSLYIFPMGRAIYQKYNVTMSHDDSKMVDIMVDFWTSFATYGMPNTTHASDPKIWKPHSPGKNILKIGHQSTPTLSNIKSLNEERMNFWSSRIPNSI